ncbi:hypothetical protein QYE76_054405 [Lolium multiflorum]|uniref:Reverse transcriptase zinc-binding domain-containing protein n=1 Tax=Lolium multiflorum TaxID=4521 RepID=A0AAD8SZ36_LOLMU|nr:hypothetical protein QYE76_054405 [Lolium multiflorum]
MNIALLSKWIWKLYQDDDSIWATIIRAKYRDADNLFEGSGQGGSQFWKSLHKIKHFFKLGAKHLIGDGRRTFFWTDWWCQDRPIKEIFPDLFNICDNPNISVAAALDGELNIVFRRSLNPEGRRQWIELGMLTESTTLSHNKDKVTWHLESSGNFSVQSLYAKLSQGASVAYHKDVWEAKVPLKIKIFAWQLILDRLPSSQQIATRHGPASGNCALCGQVEDAGHIFFSCSLASRSYWCCAISNTLLHGPSASPSPAAPPAPPSPATPEAPPSAASSSPASSPASPPVAAAPVPMLTRARAGVRRPSTRYPADKYVCTASPSATSAFWASGNNVLPHDGGVPPSRPPGAQAGQTGPPAGPPGAQAGETGPPSGPAGTQAGQTGPRAGPDGAQAGPTGSSTGPSTSAPLPVPTSAHAALRDPHWRAAMQEEYDALQHGHTSAFLHGHLSEQVSAATHRLVDAERPDDVCLLSRSLYGLKPQRLVPAHRRFPHQLGFLHAFDASPFI